MDKLEFNRKLFCLYDDPIIWIGNYFLENGDVENYIKEFLFFSGKDGLLANGISMLTAVEIYSETYQYIQRWFQDLDIVQSDNDWLIHKSKLFTRLTLNKIPSIKLIDDFRDKSSKNYNSELRIIRNAMVTTENCQFYLKDYDLTYNKKNDAERWMMWRDLILYRDKKIDEIKSFNSFHHEFDKLIKFKTKNEFKGIKLKDTLFSQNEIDLIRQDFDSILLSNKLKKELPIVSKVKKIFKI